MNPSFKLWLMPALDRDCARGSDIAPNLKPAYSGFPIAEIVCYGSGQVSESGIAAHIPDARFSSFRERITSTLSVTTPTKSPMRSRNS
jgi:hypothetical protein